MRSDIVRSRRPFYPDGRLFYDTDVIYQLLADCDFGFVHQILSFTRMDNESTYTRWVSYEPDLPDRLIQLRTYGPQYLTPAEYQEQLRKHEREYNQFLARSWLLRREPEFWEFHRKGMATIGVDIDRKE